MNGQSLDINGLAGLVLGLGFLGSMAVMESKENFEGSESVSYPTYPQNPVFYQDAQRKANSFMNQKVVGGIPQNQLNINLNNAGDQLLSYQLYQQAVNASTPSQEQLDDISGDSQMQTGNDSPVKGGVSSSYAPYNVLGNSNSSPNNYVSEYRAVNMGSERADSISACAQNAPTFVATSLLPKPSVPGEQSWDIGAPQDVLATQNFLSAIQQLGTDTVLSSNKNASHDLRSTIPNPINVVAPWNQTDIQPDLMRRPLETNVSDFGLFGCGPAGCGVNGNYIGMDSNSN